VSYRKKEDKSEENTIGSRIRNNLYISEMILSAQIIHNIHIEAARVVAVIESDCACGLHIISTPCSMSTEKQKK